MDNGPHPQTRPEPRNGQKREVELGSHSWTDCLAAIIARWTDCLAVIIACWTDCLAVIIVSWTDCLAAIIVRWTDCLAAGYHSPLDGLSCCRLS